MNRLKVVAAYAISGSAVGTATNWVISYSSIIAWGIAGGLAGGTVGWLLPILRSFAIRHRIEDWRLEEVEFQGLKFTSAGAQRRVAWRLFIEIATRIATQHTRKEDGDDGVALKSLGDLFQLTRTAISEMQPTPNAGGETVETYALDMLNSDLRPFLSRWHPIWDRFTKAGEVDSLAWAEHNKFREELRAVQCKIAGRARGLAQIAGLKNVERFFQCAQSEDKGGEP